MARLEEYQLRITGLSQDELTEVLRSAESEVGNAFVESEPGKLFDGDIEENLKTAYVVVRMATGSWKLFKKAVERHAKKKNKDAKVEEVAGKK